MRNMILASTAAAAIGLPALAGTLTVPLGNTGTGAAFSTVQPHTNLTAAIQTSGPFENLGQIKFFAGTFAPGGYMLAHGQELQISDNSNLFSKLGTTYGGNGATTFRLPDLRGRTPIGAGGRYTLGQTVGSENIALSVSNLPSHTHQTPTGFSNPTGTGTSYSNMMPSLALDFEVVTQGTFPSRRGGGSTDAHDLIGIVTIDAAADGDGTLGGGAEWPSLDSADGALIGANDNPSLFAIYGTAHGGNGSTTFGLPDTEDKVIAGVGSGLGLTPRALGQESGSSTETLTVAELPSHTHNDPDFDVSHPSGGATQATGGGLSENNLQDELALNWIIATTGLFPSRSGGLVSGEPLLGEMALFGGSFAPAGWTFADGRLLRINDNPALFSILGTNFGGDGRTLFGLPDLRGRVAVGASDSRDVGRRGGFEDIFLNVSHLPVHRHTIERAVTTPSAVPLPAGAWLMLSVLGGLFVVRRRNAT